MVVSLWDIKDIQEEIDSWWVYNKYKARLIVKGYKQKENVDYFDTYSPITRIYPFEFWLLL